MLYLEIEGAARADEWGVEAFGTLAAISNAFGTKDAVKKFVRALKPKKDAGTSMAEVRRRFGKLAAMGMLEVKK